MCAKENNDKKQNKNSSCYCNGMAEMMGSCFPNVEINPDCFSQMNINSKKYCCPEPMGPKEEENPNCCRWTFGGSFAK